jgi:hypothetical protein
MGKLRHSSLIVSALLLIAASGGGLTIFAGKYPFDKIGKTSFVSHPLVRQQIIRHAPPAVQPLFASKAVVASPIKMANGLMFASLCEQHNCGPHSWSVLITANGASAAVCHSNWDESSQATWYQYRGRIAVQAEGSCGVEIGNIPADVVNRVKTAGQPASVAARPTPALPKQGSTTTPAAGSPDRVAMLAALRPFIEAELGSPIEFVVKRMNVVGNHAFVQLQPGRPGGARLDPDTTPRAVMFLSRNGSLENFYCCETTAILQRIGTGWGVTEYRIGATDAWYHAYLGRTPEGLFR